MVTTPLDSNTALQSLNDKKASKREDALNALGQSKSVQAIPHIAQVLATDANANVRKRAAEVLGEIGDQSAIPHLGEALTKKDEQAFIRASAADALGFIGHADGLPHLVGTLDKGVPLQVRFRCVAAMRRIGGPDASRELAERLKQTPEATLRGFMLTTLGEMGDKASAAVILEIANGQEDVKVRASALTALSNVLKQESIPHLGKLLVEDKESKIRQRAADVLGNSKQASAMPYLCRGLIEDPDATVRASVVQSLKKYEAWKDKADQVMQILQGSQRRRMDIDRAAVVEAIRPSDAQLAENQNLLTDYLIANTKGQDERMTGILALLIIQSSGENLGLAGERINKYQTDNNVPVDELRGLRIEIGGKTALDPVLKVLQDDLRDYFRVPIDALNKLTLDDWTKTIRYAQFGFLTRMVMSIVVFAIGVVLLGFSVWRFLAGQLDTTQLLGAGVSFVSGLGTILLITYTGPLVEIKNSVNDLARASAAFIGYVHRVLQISHTYSFYYLTQKINFEEMKTSSALLEEAMDDTIQKLEASDPKAVEQVIREALKNLRPSSQDGAASEPS